MTDNVTGRRNRRFGGLIPDGGSGSKQHLQRECALCGADLEITVHADGTYDGGHYWGDLLEDEGEEYWECDECYD